MLISLSTNLTGHEGRAQRQLGSSQAERFTGQLFGHTYDFVDHLAGLDFGHVVLGVALTVTHTHFCGLGRDWLVREHADPDTAATLHVTGNRTTCGFDLAGRQTATVRGLQTEIAEGNGVATGSDTGVAALLFLTELAACRLQHVYSPLPSAAVAGASALRTRLTESAPAAAALSL